MSSLQKWLVGLAALLGIGTAVVVTKPSKPSTPTPIVTDTTHHDTAVTAPPTSPPASTVPSIAHDDFTGYSSTAALQSFINSKQLYNDGWSFNLIALDQSVLYQGHPTMRFDMPGGTKTTPALWATLHGAYDITWFRAKVRFSPGFTTVGTTPNTNNAFKLFGWTHETYDGSGRLEIANTNQYQLYWNVQAKNSGTLVGGGKYLLAGNITTEWTDGGWYDYVIAVDRSKIPATIALWMAKDGQTLVSKGATTETMNNGSQMPRVTGIGFSIEFNQSRAANQTQALWVGQWEVIDGVKYPNPYHLSAN